MTDPAGRAGSSQSPSRRPGPRVDVDVPVLLVSTAERMFAEQGIGSVSLRAVAREAGVAPAAVSYHYSSKPALVAAVIARRELQVGQQMRDGLTRLIESEEPVTVRDLVDALMQPFVDLLASEPVTGLHWLKIFSRLALTDDPIFLAGISREPNLPDLFWAASARALPDVDDDVQRRVGLGVYGMITALAGADLTGYGRPLGADGVLDRDFVEQLARFTAAGISLGVDPGVNPGVGSAGLDSATFGQTRK